MSEYTETYTEHEVWKVIVTVEGAESEQAARDLASEHYDLSDGRYAARGGAVVEVNRELEDSETDWNDDGEWEPDDDEDDDDDYS
jgi:hypothetical protein